MERKKLLMGLFAALLMATSTLGFVLSMGTFKPQSFEYSGKCLATVESVKDTLWLVYTLKDLNLPGTRNGPYVEVIPTEEVELLVKDQNLLYWTNAEVNVSVEGYSFSGEAYVLGVREPGDTVVLECYVVFESGRPVYFRAIEIPG